MSNIILDPSIKPGDFVDVPQQAGSACVSRSLLVRTDPQKGYLVQRFRKDHGFVLSAGKARFVCICRRSKVAASMDKLRSFLEANPEILCIAVDPFEFNAQAVAVSLGCEVATDALAYTDFKNAMYAGESRRFVIPTTTLFYDCQNWEQAFFQKFVLVPKDSALWER